jgi:D-xylose transport system substrate-binding protein
MIKTLFHMLNIGPCQFVQGVKTRVFIPHRKLLKAALIMGLGITAPTTMGANQEIKIGVSLPTQAEEHWVRDKKAMEEKAKQLGVDLKVQITNNDSARQTSQVENLLSQGIQVLIIAPHDSESARGIVEKAKKMGVKVIAYDRLITNADIDLYLAIDNVHVGELQGAYLAQKVPKGQYILLSGSPTDHNALLYKQGAMKKLAPLIERGDIHVIADQPVKDWQPAEAQKIVEQALTKAGNKVDAILAPNDGTAGGAIQALSAQKLAGKVIITGQDAERAAVMRLLKGTQSMTIFKNSAKMSALVVEVAVKMIRKEPLDQPTTRISNGKYEVPAILFQGQIVEKADIDPILIGSGYLTKKEVYR